LVDNDSEPPDTARHWLAAAAPDRLSVGDGRPLPMPSLTPSSETSSPPLDDAAVRLRILGESSTNPAICPFLRATSDGGLGPPIETSDPTNRCTAIGEPTPQSGRQQELVCLTRGHGNCPRYLRGAMVHGDPKAASLLRKGPSVAVVGAALTLAIAAFMSVGFLLVRGGFDLALASPSANNVVAAAATPGPTTISVATSPSAPPSPSPSTMASVEPTPSVTSSPTPIATPTPTVAPSRTPAPKETPTSDRYALLKPCPSTPNCWVYTVRSGDNFRSIVDWFGVPYDTVVSMNPQIPDPTRITTGVKIRMPPPTR
jgi:hypothetical protein